MIGEFPGSRSSTRTATSARRPTSAASTRRSSSSGSAPTPRRSSRARASSRGRRSSVSRRSIAASAALVLARARRAPRRATRACQVGADEFGFTLSRAIDHGGPGDRRARQLRRGRPRPRPAPGRRHAHVPRRHRPPGACRRARGAPPPRALSCSGAPSPITGLAGCARRCASRKLDGGEETGDNSVAGLPLRRRPLH